MKPWYHMKEKPEMYLRKKLEFDFGIQYHNAKVRDHFEQKSEAFRIAIKNIKSK